MATHSSTFAWKIPWTEEPGRLQSMGLQELDTTEYIAQSSRTTLLKVWSKGHLHASATPKMLTKIQVLIQ